MEPKRQREMTLAVLALLLAVAAYAAYQTLSDGSTTSPLTSRGTASSSNKQTARGRASAESGKPGAAEAPEVHLQELNEGRPKPNAGGRDLFRYRVKPPPPPAPVRVAVGPPLPPAAAGPPPLPPISLKFIGVVEMPPPAQRVAVLSDGRGAPVYGHEGDTVLGQFRILRIGAESIEMSYLDGRGRQTIRLSGS